MLTWTLFLDVSHTSRDILHLLRTAQDLAREFRGIGVEEARSTRLTSGIAGGMCFYRKSIWACGHWEWGPIVQRCSQDDVEVGGCHNKLVFAATSQSEECAACCRIVRRGIELEALRNRVEGMLQDQARPTSLGLVVRDMDTLDLELQQAKAGVTSQGLVGATEKGRAGPKHKAKQFFRCHWCGVLFHREEFRTEHIFMYHRASSGQQRPHTTV